MEYPRKALYKTLSPTQPSWCDGLSKNVKLILLLALLAAVSPSDALDPSGRCFHPNSEKSWCSQALFLPRLRLCYGWLHWPLNHKGKNQSCLPSGNVQWSDVKCGYNRCKSSAPRPVKSNSPYFHGNEIIEYWFFYSIYFILDLNIPQVLLK